MARIEASAKTKGAKLALGSVAIVSLGFSFGAMLPAVQAVLGMALFGGGFLIAKVAFEEGIAALDPRSLTRAERRGVAQHALTSTLMKIGGPVAFVGIGPGPYASITAMGSLLAGVASATMQGRLLRVATFLGVLIATGALVGTKDISVVGFVAAVAAATHTFNLPSQAKLLGDKRDRGVAQANVVCILVVIPLVFPLSEYLGQPVGGWKWGPTELMAMAMVGLLATALAAMMQTRSAAYLSKADMGAWAATAPAIQPVVATAMAPLLGTMTPMPAATQWAAFGIVTITSAVTVRLDPEAAEATEHTATGKEMFKKRD